MSDVPQIEGENGLVLSTAWPRWFYAALVKRFTRRRAWIGMDDPAMDRVIVVFSNHPTISAGDVFPRSKPLELTPQE